MKVEIAGVSKIYGSKRALDQVRIELPPGGFKRNANEQPAVSARKKMSLAVVADLN